MVKQSENASPGSLFLSSRLTLVLRLILGLTFFIFGISKMFDLEGFVTTVLGYGVLPDGIATIYGYVLPSAEVIVGIFLILGFGVRWVSAIAILITASLIVGTTANVYFVRTGMENCGCLPGVAWPPGISHLVIQGIMLVMSIQIWLNKGQFLSLDSLLSKKSEIGPANSGPAKHFLTYNIFLYAVIVLVTLGIISFFGQDRLTSSFPVQAKGDNKKVEIVIYSDFQCGACERLHREIEPILTQKYVSTGKGEIEIRLLPALGIDSMRAAQAALCAADQGYFAEYRDTIYRNWRENDADAYSLENLVETAKSLGINEDTFVRDLNQEIKKTEIEQNMVMIKSLGVHTVPAVFIGSTKIEGFKPLDTYVQAVDNALSQK